MAHYAFLDENNYVIEVIPGRDENDVVDGISDWEEYYGNIRGLRCKRTSYNSYGGFNGRTLGDGFRKNFAGIGFMYSDEHDAFIPPQPYPSWVLDQDGFLWVAPTEMPQDGKHYDWDEQSLSWITH